MERRRQRRTGNRNKGTEPTSNITTKTNTTRRRILNRRNRRLGQGLNRRNRLERAQGELRNNRRLGRRNNRRIYKRRNLRLRKIFVGGLPYSVNNRELYNLFRIEGRLLNWRVVYNRYNGLSRGWGDLEFVNPRDAWRAIRKWDGTTYKGLILRVEYKKTRPRRRRNYGFIRGYNRGFNRGGYNRRGRGRGRYY